MSFTRMGGKPLKSHEITMELIELKKIREEDLISADDFEEIKKSMVKQLKSIWN